MADKYFIKNNTNSIRLDGMTLNAYYEFLPENPSDQDFIDVTKFISSYCDCNKLLPSKSYQNEKGESELRQLFGEKATDEVTAEFSSFKFKEYGTEYTLKAILPGTTPHFKTELWTLTPTSDDYEITFKRSSKKLTITNKTSSYFKAFTPDDFEGGVIPSRFIIFLQAGGGAGAGYDTTSNGSGGGGGGFVAIILRTAAESTYTLKAGKGGKATENDNSDDDGSNGEDSIISGGGTLIATAYGGQSGRQNQYDKGGAGGGYYYNSSLCTLLTSITGGNGGACAADGSSSGGKAGGSIAAWEMNCNPRSEDYSTYKQSSNKTGGAAGNNRSGGGGASAFGNGGNGATGTGKGSPGEAGSGGGGGHWGLFSSSPGASGGNGFIKIYY